jgi:ubiquinone biosynthesis protein
VPLGELSLRDVFQSITAAMARHRLRLPADVLLLIKSVSTIESVGRQLDPSFQIVEYATPHVEAMLMNKRRPVALARRAVESSHDALKALATVPANVAEIVAKTRRDGLRVEFVHTNLEHFIREMDRSSNRLSFSVVIAAIVVASAIIVHAAVGPTFWGYPLLGLIGFVTAGWLGIGLAIGILRSGRL